MTGKTAVAPPMGVGTSSVAITAATNARVFAADLLQVQQIVMICSS
jgi:phosphoribosylcarboxyaminoimidazole (NCAIR) mutase